MFFAAEWKNEVIHFVQIFYLFCGKGVLGGIFASH
jgi:hypothetical protein